MLHCAILDDYQGTALSQADFAPLQDRVSFSVFSDHLDAAVPLMKRLAPFEIVVAMRERTPFDADRLAQLPNLRLLITTGMRNASIDLEAAHRDGITVCGTDGFAGSTAELTWGLLLALVRHIPREFANFRAGGHWQLTVGRDLRGLTLGIIGLGTLGSRVAAYGKAFGMNVLGWSRNNTPERSAGLGLGFAPDLETLLSQSDAVSIHIPLNRETHGLIGARELGLMKRDALLLNTSRGPIIDEPALIDALTAGRIGGAGLDVFGQEPLPPDHPFRTLENVVATPHLGYVTQNSYRAYFSGVVEDVTAWLDGRPIRLLTPARP
ncbi:MAG: D-2-hydroxyacid dehydrogenase family protein [Hyphomicrobiales bacterium]|nr:D-2-hydroxyacid dehydrogenase family protein [Hyphomicrobiales bacterium]